MQTAPNRAQGPNWVENPEGDVVPSYTGPNAPKYPNEDPDTRRRELEEIHPEFAPPAETTEATIAVRGIRLQDPELDKEWHARYDDGRPTVPTSQLTTEEQNANYRRHLVEHSARTVKQQIDPNY